MSAIPSTITLFLSQSSKYARKPANPFYLDHWIIHLGVASPNSLFVILSVSSIASFRAGLTSCQNVRWVNAICFAASTFRCWMIRMWISVDRVRSLSGTWVTFCAMIRSHSHVAAMSSYLSFCDSANHVWLIIEHVMKCDKVEVQEVAGGVKGERY